MKNFVSIAIDGVAGAGKSTVAVRLKDQLNYAHVNTGELYRAITLFYINSKMPLNNEQDAKNLVDSFNLKAEFKNKKFLTYINGECVTELLHKEGINKIVPNVSPFLEIRKKVVEIQRSFCENNNVVIEGRDIGTIVLPDATYKFYLTADLDTRVKRRHLEYLQSGDKISYDEVLQEVKHRDNLDSNRENSPLVMAKDAILIDTTNKTIDEVVETILNIVKKPASKKDK